MKNLVMSMLAMALIFFGCHRDEKDAGESNEKQYAEFKQKSQQPDDDEAAIDWNRVNAGREDEDIAFFTQRYGWNVERRGNGLRIEILKEGRGELIKSEDEVTLEYVTCLLTGDTVYTSKQLGPKSFRVDKSNEISGLHEAVKSLRKGSVAHIVIPSFLAYGVAGDGERIRGKASLAMTVEVTDVKPK